MIIPVITDTTGIVSMIDEALQDFSVGGDAMRWQPPSVVVTFTWGDQDDDYGAMFTGVSPEAAGKFRAGDPVTVNGSKYSIMEISLDSPGVYEIKLIPVRDDGPDTESIVPLW